MSPRERRLAALRAMTVQVSSHCWFVAGDLPGDRGFLLDSCMSRQAANDLIAARFPGVVRGDKVGLRGASDPEHLAYAVRHRLVWVTRDILARKYLKGQSHAGVLFIAGAGTKYDDEVVAACLRVGIMHRNRALRALFDAEAALWNDLA